MTSRRSVVAAQEPAETLTTTDHATCLPRRHAVDQLVADPLVIPLTVVVNHELVDHVSDVALHQRDHAVQTLLFD